MEYLHIDEDLHLEKIKKSHAAPVFEIIQRDRNYLRRWLPFVDQTRYVKDTEKYVGLILSPRHRDQNAVYTVWFRGKLAGLAGFKEIDPVNHKTEIGYWLAEQMQGKGIMTRTVKKMIDFGFRNMNMNRIQIKVAVGNFKSAAIPHRLGLKFEGIERNGEFHTDRYYDLEVFSILKADWIDTIIKTQQPVF
jgi:ribosomal-protein-serine acetyltransferase